MKLLRVVPWLILLLIVACGQDEENFDINGSLIIDGEQFLLGQSSLIGSSDADGFFSINLYPAGTIVNLDQFSRPNIVSRADVEGADFQIWGLNSPLSNALETGEYVRNFTSVNDFEFSDAEILIRRDASGGAGDIVAYEYESGTFSVNSQTSEDLSLSWDMIFINNDPPFDEVKVTGSYQGAFLYSEF